jgi:hypothetical protein
MHFCMINVEMSPRQSALLQRKSARHYGISVSQFTPKASIRQKNGEKLLNVLNGCGASLTVYFIIAYSKTIRY